MAKREPRHCTAKNNRGKPCGRPPILGGFVCPNHGGNLPCVRKKANDRLADLIDPDRALREAARLAYSDIRELYDDNGQLKPLKQWPDDLAAAVGGVEFVRRNVDGADGHSDDVIKVKLWDKPKNLELLFRHLGLLKEGVTVNVNIGTLAERLAAGRKRANAGSR